MPQTRANSRASQVQPAVGDGTLPPIQQNDPPIQRNDPSVLQTNTTRRPVDSNNDDHSLVVGGTDNDVAKLRIDNKTLLELLRKYMRKSASRNEEKEDTATLAPGGHTRTTLLLRTRHLHSDRLRLESLKTQGVYTFPHRRFWWWRRDSFFDRLMEKDAGLKAWAENDLRKLIDSTVAENFAAYTLKELARKLLREQNGSSFTQRIVEAAPRKKFPQPKFNIYNGRTGPADHIKYYQQVMAYWILYNTVTCRMFPASLGKIALRWFTRLPPGQIDSFRKLAEQFTTGFITNSRVVNGPEALTNLRKTKDETLRDYSSRYWEVYQEAEGCDIRFALNTFKYELPKDSNGINNSLTRRPPQSFDELLSKIDEYARVEDDEIMAGNRKRQGNGNKNEDMNIGGNDRKFDRWKRHVCNFYHQLGHLQW